MMRTLIVLAVIVLVLALAGWLKFSNPAGTPTIQVDTEKAKQDTSAIVEESRQAVGRAVNSLDRATEGADTSSSRVPEKTE